MIFINNLDPVMFSVGGLDIRWYGALFALGVLGYYFLAEWMFKREKYPLAHLESLVIYLFVGLLVGARLGHVFFYESAFYLSQPLEIFKIWKGGLASHGAIIGLVLMYFVWTRVNKVSFLKYIDILVIPGSLTGFFVRLGNYFNSEIVGIPSGDQWGVVFMRLGEDFSRHPVQMYESLMNLFVFGVMIFAYTKVRQEKWRAKFGPGRGFLFFLFFTLYFGMRFVAEFWKERDGLLEGFALSMGQTLSLLPFIVGAFGLIWIEFRRRFNSTA